MHASLERGTRAGLTYVKPNHSVRTIDHQPLRYSSRRHGPRSGFGISLEPDVILELTLRGVASVTQRDVDILLLAVLCERSRMFANTGLQRKY